MTMIILDFEASGLMPGSYPIEVAWIDASGHVECMLIRPSQNWLDDEYLWSL